MAVTHIIPNVNTSRASEIRVHQGSATRLSPVNLIKLIDYIDIFGRNRQIFLNKLYSTHQSTKTYLPNNIYREGSNEKIAMTTIIDEMFRLPKKQECRYCPNCYSDTNGQFIGPKFLQMPMLNEINSL